MKIITMQIHVAALNPGKYCVMLDLVEQIFVNMRYITDVEAILVR